MLTQEDLDMLNKALKQEYDDSNIQEKQRLFVGQMNEPYPLDILINKCEIALKILHHKQIETMSEREYGANKPASNLRQLAIQYLTKVFKVENEDTTSTKS